MALAGCSPYKALKIGIISNVAGYSWAGSEELWFSAANMALSQGHEVSVCLHPDLCESAHVSQLIKAGVRTTQWYRCRIARMEGLRQKVQPNFSLKKLGYPDAILVSLGALPAINYVPGLAKFLLEGDTPFVILCQFNSDSLPISAKEREMTRRLLAKSSSQVFVSEQNLNLARRQFALDLANAEVIYNPIRTVLGEPLKYPDLQNGIEFACVARFETLWKGQDLLVEILSKQPWINRKWFLHFYGEGPDFDHVQNYVKLMGLEDRFIFEGYVRSVSEIWSKCHAMVLPSRGEGTPLAVLEAMMCGRLAVTTDVGGNSEILEDGVTGWIAETATPLSFGNAMERAWQARSHWEKMGIVAHEKAQKLNNNRPAEKLLEVIQKVKIFYTKA